jgi:hypothetical protein
MSKIIKRQANVGIGKETTRGTKVAPSYWLKFLGFDVDDKFETAVNEQAIGVIEDADDLEITKKSASGKIEGKINDQSFGLILLGTFGAVSSAVKGGETTVYEHDFSVAESTAHQSLTVEIKYGTNEQKAYPNAVVEGLTIKADPKSYVGFEMDIQAKTGETASNTPSQIEENHFAGRHVTVKLADDLAGLGAATAIAVREIEFKIEKNVESDDVLGSVTPADFYNKQFAVTGTLTLVFNDTSLKTIALNNTQKAMRITIENTDVTIGSASNPKLVIDLAKVKASEYSREGGLNDVITQSIVFKGLYSMTDSQMVVATLTNEVASY